MNMKTSILIVEDEGIIALDLKKKLEGLGYSVAAIADNAADALHCAEHLRPALVLMDISIRGDRDGIETAEEIRRWFHLPVMFVTSHSDQDTLERARITEPFGYIVKPFHGASLAPQIEMAIWKHRMEERLRASEAWLSTVVRNVADALIATNHEGDVVLMNAQAEALTGFDLVSAKGRPLLEIFQVFDEATGVPVVHPLETLFDGRELSSGAQSYKLLKRGRSEEALVEAEFSSNWDEGSLMGIIVVFRDITERRKAEEQDRLLQKMNALALMAVGLGRELAESQRGMDRSVNELMAVSRGHAVSLLADIYERTAYQQSVVQQLVTLGASDRGKPEPVDLNELVAGLEVSFKKTLGFRDVLTMKLEPNLPAIRVDVPELRRSLLRLAADARASMPDGGTVEISTGATARGVQLTIRDSGKGIRPGAKERVFDPYYQSRSGNRNPGFSLALVYHFVTLSGGAIEVESGMPEGTAYVLTFPMAEAAPDQVAAKATAALS